MILHNTVEDVVISRVNDFFQILEKEGKTDLCLCNQCRMDTICYALNRIPPYYIVSNRGASRVQHWESFEWQQTEADISSLISEGVKRVNHNQRPNFSHRSETPDVVSEPQRPVYNVPTIIGRIFNGSNFAPMAGVDVELLWNGNLVVMKDGNWQNPCRLVANTEGNFSFWPAPDIASKVDKHKIFEYTLRVTGQDYEPLIHFFKIPVASEVITAGSFSLERTFKLPDLYMFPPGDAEQNGCQD